MIRPKYASSCGKATQRPIGPGPVLTQDTGIYVGRRQSSSGITACGGIAQKRRNESKWKWDLPRRQAAAPRRRGKSTPLRMRGGGGVRTGGGKKETQRDNERDRERAHKSGGFARDTRPRTDPIQLSSLFAILTQGRPGQAGESHGRPRRAGCPAGGCQPASPHTFPAGE